MKSIQKSLILLVAVAATAVLLLAGCQQGNHGKDKVPAVEQTEAVVDTTEEDTMAAFYERMQRWKALHGWTDRWKSEK
ncbi:MAG: hypothetical protein IKX35_03545 [Bacteroidales bacterium]|nr:hypothetical protein [Bacteroidales bacterium]